MNTAAKLRLIFVDDEPAVLDGLRRSLHGCRTEWSMEFANGGAKALEMMAQQPFDVLVTDMRMPGMDGAQLLQEVTTRYPRTIRIVLSGQSSREALLRSIAPSHQFLSKPCTAEELKRRIANALALQQLLESSAIKTMISGLGSIPTLPTSYHEILQELQSKEPSIAHVAAIISRDPAMTAKILQLANSALLGVRCQVSNARQAVTLMGLEMIQALVISVHIFSRFDEQRVQELQIPQLWKHCLATACCARAIAESEQAPKAVLEDCFSAGLLHDIGKLVLIGSLPKQYALVMAQAANQNIPLLQAEQECFGCTHAEVGGYLIGIWGLPHAIVEAVVWHHHPSSAPAKGLTPVTAVHVADAFLSLSDFGHMRPENCLDQTHLQEAGVAHREVAWRQVCQQTIDMLRAKEMEA